MVLKVSRVAAMLVVILGYSCKTPAESIAPAEFSAVSTNDPLFFELTQTPWLDAPNISERYFPVHVGASPRELSLGAAKVTRPRLPSSLKPLMTAQMAKVLTTLPPGDLTIQVWPTTDWNGQPNWVLARFKHPRILVGLGLATKKTGKVTGHKKSA